MIVLLSVTVLISTTFVECWKRRYSVRGGWVLAYFRVTFKQTLRKLERKLGSSNMDKTHSLHRKWNNSKESSLQSQKCLLYIINQVKQGQPWVSFQHCSQAKLTKAMFRLQILILSSGFLCGCSQLHFKRDLYQTQVWTGYCSEVTRMCLYVMSKQTWMQQQGERMIYFCAVESDKFIKKLRRGEDWGKGELKEI